MTVHWIGLISDTHGLVRAEVHTALAGVELILHAGDVGGAAILDELSLIAPVKAVAGNTDAPDDVRLRDVLVETVDGLTIHVSHGHELGSPTPAALLARYPDQIIVYGHTHIARVERAGDRWVVNPGAAGPRRFGARPSVAKLRLEGGTVAVEVISLALRAAERSSTD